MGNHKGRKTRWRAISNGHKSMNGHKKGNERNVKMVNEHKKINERKRVNELKKIHELEKAKERKRAKERKKAIKGSRTCNDTEPEPNMQTVDKERPLDIVNIDPDGDLILKAKYTDLNTAYKVNSHVIQRVSPGLYEQCLGVQPADGAESTWMFEDLPRVSGMPTATVMCYIHGNPATFVGSPVLLHEAVFFTIQCGMFDYCLEGAKQWYQNMDQAITTITSTYKPRHMCCLWLAVKLGLHNEVIRLQRWAIFVLDRELSDPPERFDKLSLWRFNEKSEEAVRGK